MKRRPPKKIPKDQRWFWTPEWQAKEEEADKDLAAGRFETFTNVEDAIRWLKSPLRKRQPSSAPTQRKTARRMPH